MTSFLETDFKTLTPIPAMSPASYVYCSLLSESVYLDSPKPSLGSVAKVKVLQSLHISLYLGRKHGLQIGHVLFQQQLDLANYVAAAVHHRFISELFQTSFAIFGTLRSAFSSGDEAFSSIAKEIANLAMF